VGAAFAHRRKTLAGALRLSGLAVGDSTAGDARARTREALTELGLSEDVRAERLSPREFVALAGKLGLS
jgi:16S rRNA A1518/A1519 N6-dimethyltransferase RsmA/KsgA/DIM1 with predicted DNA glycosylase/AP lyase activity